MWQGIKNNWQRVQDGLRWKLGNRAHIRFWEDRWLSNQSKLSELSTQTLPKEVLEVKIKDIVTENGEWNSHNLESLLT